MTPGIVGQMYENRRSKQIGVLESHDEKYKTILMRDKDGKSFNVNFSTFKSNWRKYQGDEVIQTSNQVEAEREEKRAEVEKAEKEVTKQPKAKMSREDMFKAVKSSQTIIEHVAESYSGIHIKVLAKGGIQIKVGNQCYSQIWVKGDTFNVRLRSDVYENSKEWADKQDVKFFQNDKLQYSVQGFELASMEEVTCLTMDAIVETVNQEVTE